MRCYTRSAAHITSQPLRVPSAGAETAAATVVTNTERHHRVCRCNPWRRRQRGCRDATCERPRGPGVLHVKPFTRCFAQLCNNIRQLRPVRRTKGALCRGYCTRSRSSSWRSGVGILWVSPAAQSCFRRGSTRSWGDSDRFYRYSYVVVPGECSPNCTFTPSQCNQTLYPPPAYFNASWAVTDLNTGKPICVEPWAPATQRRPWNQMIPMQVSADAVIRCQLRTKAMQLTILRFMRWLSKSDEWESMHKLT